MKTIKTVDVLSLFVDEIPPKEQLGQNTIYIAEKWKACIHLCLCGCGEIISTPLVDNGWTLTKQSNNRISLSPSIGNYQYACASHYVITKNKANFL